MSICVCIYSQECDCRTEINLDIVPQALSTWLIGQFVSWDGFSYWPGAGEVSQAGLARGSRDPSFFISQVLEL